MISHTKFLKALNIVNQYKAQVAKQSERLHQDLSNAHISPIVLSRETPLIDSDLGTKVVNILLNCRYIKSQELTETVKMKHFDGMTFWALCRIEGIGRKSLKEIENCFFEANVSYNNH